MLVAEFFFWTINVWTHKQQHSNLCKTDIVQTQQIHFQATYIKRAAETTHCRLTWGPRGLYCARSHFSRASGSLLKGGGARRRDGGREGANVERSTADSCAWRKDAAQINSPRGRSTRRSSNNTKGHATSTRGGDMVMQLELTLKVDFSFVRKGGRTSEWLLYAAFNTANKREWQQLDCTEDIDTFWLGPYVFIFFFSKVKKSILFVHRTVILVHKIHD